MQVAMHPYMQQYVCYWSPLHKIHMPVLDCIVLLIKFLWSKYSDAVVCHFKGVFFSFQKRIFREFGSSRIIHINITHRKNENMRNDQINRHK
jgi:hypothetical protein